MADLELDETNEGHKLRIAEVKFVSNILPHKALS